jgi:hypothetical protein
MSHRHAIPRLPTPSAGRLSARLLSRGRRHDLEALTAYGAYRRSHTLEEWQSGEATRMADAQSGEAGTTALQDWEDEGGAIG